VDPVLKKCVNITEVNKNCNTKVPKVEKTTKRPKFMSPRYMPGIVNWGLIPAAMHGYYAVKTITTNLPGKQVRMSKKVSIHFE
jgi:hypothetical protein